MVWERKTGSAEEPGLARTPAGFVSTHRVGLRQRHGDRIGSVQQAVLAFRINVERDRRFACGRLRLRLRLRLRQGLRQGLRQRCEVDCPAAVRPPGSLSKRPVNRGRIQHDGKRGVL